jgi:hypothetical protein
MELLNPTVAYFCPDEGLPFKLLLFERCRGDLGPQVLY